MPGGLLSARLAARVHSQEEQHPAKLADATQIFKRLGKES